MRFRQHGFTLIELMVVIVILGLIMGIVVPNVMLWLGESEEDIARMQMRQIGTAVDLYELRKRELPDRLAVLTDPDPRTGHALLPEIPLDPWKSEYGYQRFITERRYQIQCNGADRQSDTDDDLFHPKRDD